MTRIFLAAALLAAPAVAAPSAIEGQWANPTRSVTVRIAPCGPSLCGRVIAASAAARAKAAAAGTPRLVGTELMSQLTPVGRGLWQGEFFVPDRNIRAPGELRQLGPRVIEIEGCVGGLLCKSQQWTRVTAAAKPRRRR